MWQTNATKNFELDIFLCLHSYILCYFKLNKKYLI